MGSQTLERWMCDRCGKVISSQPFGRCHDCGGMFITPTADDLACDRCGADDSSRVFGPTDYRRLCGPCIDEVNDG